MKISRLEWNASAGVEMSGLEWKCPVWSGNTSTGVEMQRLEWKYLGLSFEWEYVASPAVDESGEERIGFVRAIYNTM